MAWGGYGFKSLGVQAFILYIYIYIYHICLCVYVYIYIHVYIMRIYIYIYPIHGYVGIVCTDSHGFWGSRMEVQGLGC